MEPLDMSLAPGDYADRPGYQPSFLGAPHQVPLPTVTGKSAKDLAPVHGGGHELRYWTYTVLMSRSRKLPILSAANYDRDSRAHNPRPDQWRFDPRLTADPKTSDELQVGSSWYEHQAKDRSGQGPFDKGHLTAYENGDWGANSEAPRNGADTFHYTNAAPQAKAFNEHKIWREIEVWAAAQGTSGKISIFNGPIFDAPPSTPLDSGEFQLHPFNEGTPDPLLYGLNVPKQFFKVAIYVDSTGLAVKPFIVTQEAYLAALAPALAGPTKRELTLYQVPLAAVSHLTGIDFGDLSKPGKPVRESLPGDFQLIKRLSDLR